MKGKSQKSHEGQKILIELVKVAKERIHKSEKMKIEISHKNRKKKRMRKNEQYLRDLWDVIKCANVHIINVLEIQEKNDRILFVNNVKKPQFDEKQYSANTRSPKNSK